MLTVAHCPDFPNVDDFLRHLSVVLVSSVFLNFHLVSFTTISSLSSRIAFDCKWFRERLISLIDLSPAEWTGLLQRWLIWSNLIFMAVKITTFFYQHAHKDYIQVLNYPLYDQAGYNGDLALLRLDSPVQFRWQPVKISVIKVVTDHLYGQIININIITMVNICNVNVMRK